MGRLGRRNVDIPKLLWLVLSRVGLFAGLSAKAVAIPAEHRFGRRRQVEKAIATKGVTMRRALATVTPIATDEVCRPHRAALQTASASLAPSCVGLS